MLFRSLFTSIVDKKNTPDPWSLEHRISKVKDINKLSTLVENPYKKLELSNFFSQDILDIKWIPKFRKKKKVVEEVDYNKKFDGLKKI